jgi:hypothetical protein
VNNVTGRDLCRNSAAGKIVDVTTALLERLRFPSREALRALNAVTLQRDPAGGHRSRFGHHHPAARLPARRTS